MNYFEDLSSMVKTALNEDIRSGDLTADLIPQDAQAEANIICRENAIICGRPWFDETFQQIDNNIKIEWFCGEGEMVEPDTLVCKLQGSARALLTAERTALNFLQSLSGTATTSNNYVNALGETATKLLDTRKTLPGMRLAQKYAVKMGGATNHRVGLYDAILLKENHIMAAGGIQEAVSTAKKLHPNKTVEVETENLDEVTQALAAKADIIMLDNFTLSMMSEAVQLNNGQAKLEVSGNVEIENLPELASTGVDFISTGAITKHLRAIDFSMRFQIDK